jgi:hypothetical protein
MFGDVTLSRADMPNLFQTGFCVVAAELIRWRMGRSLFASPPEIETHPVVELASDCRVARFFVQ